MRYILVFLMVIFMTASMACAQNGPVVGDIPQKVETEFVQNPQDLKVETWIRGLEVPWSLKFFPDGRAIVSERPGRIRLIRQGELVQEPYLALEVSDIGEGGLMGLEVHPDFPEAPYIYDMYTYRNKDQLYNRVQRFVDLGDKAKSDKIIIDHLPGSRFHNGGRLGFSPDGLLYITIGENFRAKRAQDLNTLAGSILRVSPDGSIPEENPFPESPIWSYGHRNPQGLTWHPETKDLFASEHGPSGEFGLHGHDIVNVIFKGKNYGWPLEIGAGGLEQYQDPIIMWKQATPPAGMTFWRERLYLTTLRSESLIRIDLKQKKGSYQLTSIEALFAPKRYQGTHGRLRAAVVGPDQDLYVLTSNLDGRGSPRQGDDKILRISPK